MPPDADDLPALDPDAIAGRSFTRVRKGFEVDEVRAFLVALASDVREAERLRSDAERRIAELERRGTDPRDLDEAQVTQLLGEETARVLETARTAAADIRAKAAQEADELGERSAADARAAREAADEYATATREAADAYDREVRERVDAEVAELRAAAEAETQEMTAQAESVLAERTAEAEAAATAIVAEATAEAERIRAEVTTYDAETRTAADIYASETRSAADAVRAEAESAAADRVAASEQEVEAILEGARAEGRAMVEEARSYRERVIADLADRRRIARGQLEQLAATRDELAVTLTDVAGRVEASHRAVVDTVVDARSLGDVAGDRAALGVDAAPSPSTSDAEPDAPGDEDSGGEPAEEVDGAPESAGTPADATAETVSGGEPTPEEGAAPESADDPGDGSEPEPEVAADGVGSEVTAEEPEPEPEPEAPADEPEPATDGGDTADEGEPTDGAGPDDGPAAAAAGADDDEAQAAAGGDDVVGGADTDRVDAVFAQLKAQAAGDAPGDASPDDADDAGGVAGDAAEAGVDGSATEGDGDEVGRPGASEAAAATAGEGGEGAVDAAETADGEADADQALLDRRDATTDALERQLARRLKRVLSDEQNEALDRLRRSKGDPDAEAVLLGEGEHLGRYHEAALADLIDAERAGAGFFGEAPSQAAEVGDVAQEFAAELVRQLRSRLEAAFADGGDEQEVSDRIRACYREWKTQRIAETAAHYVLVAFNRGVAEATDADGSARWVVDDGGAPCPDCDDNALAGAVPHGTEFPTGDLHPPAHPGCRCLAAPA